MFVITDFLVSYPRFKGVCSSPQAEDVFNTLIVPANIHKMIVASELKRPALEAVIEELEADFVTLSTLHKSSFDLHDFSVRHAIGSMVQFILKDFGYKKDASKTLKARKNAILKTASTYTKDPDFLPKYKIEIKIVSL